MRSVVSTTRNIGSIDFGNALREIAARVNSPQIHLDLQSALFEIDEPCAHALFRCAQEMITNTIKHAGAGHLWIVTRNLAGECSLNGLDDGRGNPGLKIGNGLRGIEERLRELGGTCAFGNKEGAGFEITIRFPAAQRLSA